MLETLSSHPPRGRGHHPDVLREGRRASAGLTARQRSIARVGPVAFSRPEREPSLARAGG
ncbi:MAG: hypothetical protein MZU95_14595 [Desulfomicrobium escambiense]|nr:hypothetical protein [Desulfomicrobium escambiense]